MPKEGHASETFSVGGVKFCYSDYSISPGFHVSRSNGGPIAPGVLVRIHYLGGDILKLETMHE